MNKLSQSNEVVYETESQVYVPSIGMSEGTVEKTTNCHLEEIPENVIAELENLEAETSLFMSELGGVDDILKDLLELDADFLDSLASQIGTDFSVFTTNHAVNTWSNMEMDEINLFDRSNFGEEKPREIATNELSEPTQRVAHIFSPQVQQQVKPIRINQPHRLLF